MTPTRSLVQSQPFRRMGVAQWKSSRMPVTHLPSPARRADRGMVLVNLQVAWFDSGHPFSPNATVQRTGHNFAKVDG